MEQPKKTTGCCGVVLVLLFLLTAAMLLLANYAYNNVLGQINRVEGTEATLSAEQIEAIERETDAADEIPGDAVQKGDLDVTTPAAQEIAKADHIINILLIGQDRRPGEGRTRSDSMILCTFNTQKKTLVMTSFLRDLYVDLPDWNGRTYQDNRLNACYAFGGMGMLDAALKNNFGVVVDHNIEVDFGGFEDIVELFGGVNISLTKAEADYLGGGLKEGVNHLTPKQTLEYARLRKIDSDFGRTNRQRKVLTALLESMGEMNYSKVTKIINKILPLTTTDMTNDDITRYMMEIAAILPELEITTQSIPAAGTYRSCSVRGMAVLVPDLEANRAILRDILQ